VAACVRLLPLLMLETALLGLHLDLLMVKTKLMLLLLLKYLLKMLLRLLLLLLLPRVMRCVKARELAAGELEWWLV